MDATDGRTIVRALDVMVTVKTGHADVVDAIESDNDLETETIEIADPETEEIDDEDEDYNPEGSPTEPLSLTEAVRLLNELRDAGK